MNKTQETCFFLDINLDKTEEVFITNILTCILNFVFSLITCVGNSFIVFVIRKSQNLHSPSFILLGCLAASDLLVGLICQPFFVAFKIAELVENFSAYCTLRMFQSISSWITGSVSLLTLAAVTIDCLLALTHHLRYNTTVTVPRVFQTVFALWIFSITVVMLRFWMTTKWIFFPVAIFVFIFFVITLSTFKIFRIVQRHQRQINDQNAAVSHHQTKNARTFKIFQAFRSRQRSINVQNMGDGHRQTNIVNALKCRKSAVTVLYVYGLFIIFYLPHFLLGIMVKVIGYKTTTVKIAYEYAATVVFINSFLNPLVYCWRIREIRRGVKTALRKNGQFSH